MTRASVLAAFAAVVFSAELANAQCCQPAPTYCQPVQMAQPQCCPAPVQSQCCPAPVYQAPCCPTPTYQAPCPTPYYQRQTMVDPYTLCMGRCENCKTAYQKQRCQDWCYCTYVEYGTNCGSAPLCYVTSEQYRLRRFRSRSYCPPVNYCPPRRLFRRSCGFGCR